MRVGGRSSSSSPTSTALAPWGRASSPRPSCQACGERRRSITPDYIVCLEDGKKFKSLKRHLMTHYQLTPQQYREKWGLPPDYPMVAPNYSATRSALAKTSGLGRKAPPARKGRRAAASA